MMRTKTPLPDEPTFVLMARDPLFDEFVTLWATRRASAIRCGDRPDSDYDDVREALTLANAGERWRRENLGKWRPK